jgi:glycosyltransferase involved in cell wall biosynthesis
MQDELIPPGPADAKPPRSAAGMAALRDERPSLLFVSPVMPALTGNGLAMRAGATLRALAAWYRVSLLVAPRYSAPDETIVPELARACERVTVLPSDGPSDEPDEPDEPAGPPGDEPAYDVVHLFRLATVEVGQPYLARAGAAHLDLDDLESQTRRRLAALHLEHGDEEQAGIELLEAERAEMLEAEALRTFDRVYVCSERDRAALAGRGRTGEGDQNGPRGTAGAGHPGRPGGSAGEGGRDVPRGTAAVRVVPNVVPVQGPLPAPPTSGPFRFLFVGTLGYVPNEDGVRWLAREVLPRLRAIAPRRFQIRIVGVGATEAVWALDRLPEIDVVGAVPDVRDAYREAHAVLIPLRAGGGTRIKALEAFSYRRPVVTTTVGIEGIDATPEEHVLVADSPAAFAEQCRRLMTDRALGERLRDAALDVLVRSYSPEAMVQALAPPATLDADQP